MKRRIISGVLAGVLSVGMAAASIPAVNVLADDNMGWVEENGVKYWYENGVKQGTEGRGKEIYDPSSNAWYWLDAVDGGRMTVSKDVYQESDAGQWGDIVNQDGSKTGKWVRYDAEGHMVKGWSEKDGNRYYFDPVYGTMAKGDADIDGVHYYFNTDTGILESGAATDDEGKDLYVDGWHKVDGENYWYEKGVRQGYKTNADGSIDESYRGKEIYDPESNAWYWLDNVQQGAVAKDKDVYQESEAGDWGDAAGADGKNYGKWVRYDENGNMIKGWSEKDGNKYYFDPVYGTMAKGIVSIDGKNYEFEQNTGVFLSEVTWNIDYEWNVTSNTTYNADGKFMNGYEYEYDENGNAFISRYIRAKKDGDYAYAEDENDKYVSSETKYTYSDAGEMIYKEENSYSYDKDNDIVYLSGTNIYNYENGEIKEKTYIRYTQSGEENTKSVYTYTYQYDGGKMIELSEYINGELSYTYKYEYDGDNMTMSSLYQKNGELWYSYKYTYDEAGNLIREERTDGKIVDEHTYNDGKLSETISRYDLGGYGIYIAWKYVYEYDENGELVKSYNYSYSPSGNKNLFDKSNEHLDGIYIYRQDYTFPEKEAGRKFEIDHSTTIYRDEDLTEVKSYTVDKYECIPVKSYN